MRMHLQRPLRGMSFMDVIVGTALMLLVFTALVGLLRSSLEIASLAKTRAIATSIAQSQMEYIRSLSYDQVGTVGGIPAGSVAQNATTTLNGINFPVRTFIEYADDPADGTGGADQNGITTDYKLIKITVTYLANGRTQTLDLISRYAPLGLETTTGGGTLKIKAVNAAGAGVAGATVRIVNASTNPNIDLTTFSDASGVVFLPGAATSTEYQVYVSKNGYSSAQTYARDATNQNPSPGYLTVVKDQTTTGTFAIDLLSTLTIKTFLPISSSTFVDAFSSDTNVANLTNAVVSGGGIQLASGANGYALSGNAVSVAQAPTYLVRWGIAAATTTVPSGTSIRFHVVDGSGAQLPDSAVPGNSAGFLDTVDLSSVSTSTYPTLALSADLATSATTTTPVLEDWSLSYARGPIPIGNIPFSLTGTKTTGSTGGGAPIYKTALSTATNSSGTNSLSLEWDAYSLALSSYNVVSACGAPPYSLAPGASISSSLMLASSTSNMVLVTVSDTNGPVAGASVTLSNGGAYTQVVTSDACGSAYFGSLSSDTYSVTVAKTGYTTFNATGVSISGHGFYPVSL